MIDAAPLQSPVVIVEAVTDHAPQIFLGFTAFGDRSTLMQLKIEADKMSIPVSTCPEDAQKQFLMVAFPPNGRQSTYLSFYKHALAGDFGKFRLELALLSVAKARNGSGLEEAVAVDPDYIIPPDSDGK